MKNTDFYKYGIANSIYTIFDGVDTIEEAREIIDKLTAQDEKNGHRSEYHIYKLDESGHPDFDNEVL